MNGPRRAALASGLFGLFSSLALLGCGKVQARTPVPMVALDTPEPPSRVVIPVELREPEPPPAPPTAAEPPPATPRQRDTNVRQADRPSTVTPPPPTVVAEASPPVVIQTTADSAVVEQHVRSLIKEAQGDLARLTPRYRELSASDRGQYDSANSFIRQAEEGLTIKNYMNAEFAADKAAKLARDLVKK